MSYFKVSADADNLPYIVWADNSGQAVRKVNEFAGANEKNGRSFYRAVPCEAPDAGDWVLGEPEDVEAERNKEEE